MTKITCKVKQCWSNERIGRDGQVKKELSKIVIWLKF